MAARITFQRARQPDQKAVRRAALLGAAAALLDEHGLDAVSLNAVARRAGITKSNVYRYFETREAIFLELLLEDEARWVERLERRLGALRRKGDPRAVARTIAASLADEPRFCALIASVNSVLERNLSHDAVLAFKKTTGELGTRAALAIQAALPALPTSALGPLQIALHALVAGLAPMASPPPAVRQVLARDEFAAMRVDFRRDLEATLGALLAGLTADAEPRR